MRPYLDYTNITYNKPDNESLRQKVERIQYNPAIAITGVIKEISFKSLKFRRWFRKLCTFLSLKSDLPECLFDLVPQTNHLHNTRF